MKTQLKMAEISETIPRTFTEILLLTYKCMQELHFYTSENC